MVDSRQASRANVLRHVGTARVDRTRAPAPASPLRTNIFTVLPKPPPVFVDDSGRRRRRLGTIAFALASLTLIIAAAVWFSVVMAPVRPAPVVTCTGTSTAQAAECGEP